MEAVDENNFWGAVSLIMGTAVGPGMLALPSATIKSGPLPSAIVIILSWVYVISSILLVAELSYAAMEEDGLEEVSFTGLATKALGPLMGSFVAVVYASLSFSLLVACVSGIGSIVSQWFPLMHHVVAHALFPFFVGVVIGFFPFKAIDITNRSLCFLMLLSITTLVGVGFSVGRRNLLNAFSFASWSPASILPAIPVTVLTLGFHVITPFVCKIVGKNINNVRNAVLFGGSAPLLMVLSWNVVVLGLAGTNPFDSGDPIGLLLSVSPSALPAIQAFAFAALATSLIGYAVSFPKQLTDTLTLISGNNDSKGQIVSENQTFVGATEGGRVGFAVFSMGKKGISGRASFTRSWPLFNLPKYNRASKIKVFAEGHTEDFSAKTAEVLCDSESSQADSNSSDFLVKFLVLGAPVFIASFFRAAFSKALDFAGVYANCFLFGILPPVMAWIYHSKRKLRSNKAVDEDASLLPGGNISLFILFSIAVVLGFWH